MPRIVIVGGGISGLALAYRLQQRLPDAAVVVLEREPRLGGKVGTLQRDGFRVEAGPNGFLDTNPAMLDLCRELGLGDRLIAVSEASGRNRFLFLKGRLRDVARQLVVVLDERRPRLAGEARPVDGALPSSEPRRR